MSAGSLFEPETGRRAGVTTLLIAVAAFCLISASAYGVYLYSKPLPRPSSEILAEQVRESIVLMLDYRTFSGEEFRQQVLGKGRLERYVRATDDAYFTFPDTDDPEFQAFVAKNFYDPQQVEFGKRENGIIRLGDYELPVSPELGQVFRTGLANIRFDPGQELTFHFSTVDYTVSLSEVHDFVSNSQTYGGKLITQAPDRKYRPTIIFANHGIMVAKPDEPSLKRLTDALLKDVGPDREARIQRLVDFVSNEIEYNYTEAVGSRETLKRADETLMTRNGDCSNKTILLASLLEQIGEEYVLVYCPRHITVAVPQGNFANENKLDITWNGKPWMIAETTVPGFQVGVTKLTDSNILTRAEYVQNPKNADVIFDADTYEVLKFW